MPTPGCTGSRAAGAKHPCRTRHRARRQHLGPSSYSMSRVSRRHSLLQCDGECSSQASRAGDAAKLLYVRLARALLIAVGRDVHHSPIPVTICLRGILLVLWGVGPRAGWWDAPTVAGQSRARAPDPVTSPFGAPVNTAVAAAFSARCS